MSDDLIRRSDVYKAIDDWLAGRVPNLNIKDIPSADRLQGEWEIEYHGNGWNDYWDYICSNCGKKYERADAVLYKANFCPNCGAQMKGADDGADND